MRDFNNTKISQIFVVFVPPRDKRCKREEDVFPRSRSWLSISVCQSWEKAETSVSSGSISGCSCRDNKISTALNFFFRVVNSIRTSKDTLDLREKTVSATSPVLLNLCYVFTFCYELKKNMYLLIFLKLTL